MPTGYTCKIEDGTITNGKDFIKLCLNDFGVMIHRRDEGMTMEPQNFEEVYATDVKYHEKEIEKAKAEYDKVTDKYYNHFDDYKAGMIETLTKEVENRKKCYQEELELIEKYNKIKEQVESWDCSDEYKNIKDFALNQIEISLPDIKYYEHEIKRYEERLNNIDTHVKDSFEATLQFLSFTLEYHTGELEKLRKLIVERQTFYDGIIDEINKIKID